MSCLFSRDFFADKINVTNSDANVVDNDINVADNNIYGSSTRQNYAGNSEPFKNIAGVVLLCGMALLSIPFSTFLFSRTANAATISLSVSDSITATAMPSSGNNTFTSDTNTTNISVSTGNTTGYTLSLKSSRSSAALTGSAGSIPSISEPKSSVNDFPSNAWGYRLTKKNGNNNWDNLQVKRVNGDAYNNFGNSGDYLPGPTNAEEHILDVTDSANTTANQYNLAVATKLDSTTKPGVYSNNTFIVAAVTNAIPNEFEIAYAAAGKTKVSGTDYYSMQDMTPEICSAVITNGAEATLVDVRDNNKTYSVAKLDDGNCWMTQNLALGSDTLGEITLTSADSDVSSNFTLPVPTTTSFSSSNYDVVNYRNYTSNNTNYYNWYTATAGTGKKATAAYTAATSSICPKGWRLPNGSSASGVAGEWAELFYAAGITSSLATGTSSVSYATGGAAKRAAAPYNIPNSYGYFNTTGTSPTSTSYTYFWTNRTYSSANYAWSTYIGSSSATLNYGSRYKYQGMPMRCVAHKAETKPTITYDANGGSGAPNPTQATNASELPQSITLSSTIPTRTNYFFSGWATSPTATALEVVAGGNYVTNKDVTLYAVWRLDCRAQPSMLAIQNYNTSQLPNIGDTATVCDTRDGTSYTIAKLADNKIWMLDNLALDLTNQTVLNGLDATNTNIDTTKDPGALAALKGTKLGTTSDKYATAKVANWTSSYSYSAPLINSASKDNVYGAPAAGKGFNKAGIYYNYCAASAGSYCYGNGTSEGTSSGNATSSICPKGWRMPTGGSSGEYQALYTAYSSNYTNFRNALALPLSGFFNNSSASNQGNYGYFWSSTRDDNDSMYVLRVETRNINLALDSFRHVGYSVRCVAGS